MASGRDTLAWHCHGCFFRAKKAENRALASWSSYRYSAVKHAQQKIDLRPLSVHLCRTLNAVDFANCCNLYEMRRVSLEPFLLLCTQETKGFNTFVWPCLTQTRC